MVYRAVLEESGEPIAIKVSHPCPPGSPADLAFRMEYDRHTQLRHVHILQARAFGEIDSTRRYYTMDLVDTVPLAEVHVRGGLRALGAVTLGIGQALEYAHARGIVHGDLKPSNILVAMGDDGIPQHVLLADFGNARDRGAISRIISGTSAYWSPEQVLGWPADGRSDLWALGITLFEVIAGRLPHAAGNGAEGSHPGEATLPKLADVRPDADPDWATLVDALLHPDPSRRPAGREVTRAAAFLAGTPGGAATEVAAPAFLGPALQHVGRVEELERVLADSAGGTTILLVGETGVGKTRFLDEVARKAQRRGMRVLRSDAKEGAEQAFRLFRRVRRGGAWLDLLGDLPVAQAGTLAATGAHEARLGMILDALQTESEAPGRELVFLFDSIEHADADSLDVLEGLQERMRGTRGRLVVAVDASADAIVSRLQAGEAELVHLPPLAPAEMRELVVSHLTRGAAAARVAPLDEHQLDALLRWLAEETGGVPAAIETHLDELLRLGALTLRADSTWSLDEARLDGARGQAGSVDRARELLSRLDGPQRGLLELAVLLGARFDATLLARIEDVPANDSAAFLGRALRIGLLGDTPDGAPHFRFRSPELHRALETLVPPKRRRDLHARIARALATAPDASPVEFARHLQQSGDTAAAGAALASAADAAVREGASHEAARLYEAAWEASSDEARRALVPFASAWMYSLFMVGRFADGIRIGGAILSCVAPLPGLATRERLRVETQLGHCHLLEGMLEDAERVLDRVVTTPALEACPDLAALAWMDLGHCRMLRNDYADARVVLEKAHTIARTHGELVAQGLVEIQLGHLSWRENDLRHALEWHRAAERHLAEADARDFLPSAWGNQAICQWYLLEPTAAATLHRRAAEAYLARNRRSEAARSFQNLAPILTELGRWREADEALAAADRLHRVHRGARQTSFFEYASARLAMYRGDFDEAMRRILHAVKLGEETHDDFVSVGHANLRGLIEWEAGRIDEAAATAAAVLKRSEATGNGWGTAKGFFLLGVSRHAQGRPTEARAALEQAAEVAETRTQPVAAFRVELARAALCSSEGDLEGANAALVRARKFQEPSGSILWEGLWRRHEAEVRYREGRLADALTAAARAYEIFAGLGAERWRADTLLLQSRLFERAGQRAAARSASTVAREVLRTLGLTPPPPVPGLDDDSGVEGVQRILETVSVISRRFVSPGRVDDVLDRILDAANAYLGTERGVVALYDPEKQMLVAHRHRGLDPESMTDSLEISWTSIDFVRNTGHIVFSNDALNDPTLNQRESVRRLRIRSLAVIPLHWQGRIGGALYLDHRSLPGLFGPEARRLLDYFADIASASIHVANRLEIQEEGTRHLRAEVEEDDLAFPGTVARDGRMRSLLHRGIQAAEQGRTLLLAGETGCGKSHFAGVLHLATEPVGEFVCCSLPSLTDSLFAAELFGVAAGTATSVQGRAGFIEKAMGGTLFLDEIGDLSLENQLKLLGFLDERKFCRVGSTVAMRFDGLVICATNADLKQKLAEGRFREDLFYRLDDCTLSIPPLCERLDDLPELAAMFLREHADSIGCEAPVIHPDAVQELRSRPWRGNVRELRAVLVRAATEAGPGRMICLVHLGVSSPGGVTRAAGNLRAELVELTIRRVTEALARTGGNVRAAAKYLDEPESNLRRWIEEHHLEHLKTQKRKRNGGA